MKAFFKTTLLLGALTGIFIGIGNAVGGRSGAMLAFGIAIAMNFGMFWFSHKLVLKMQRAKPLDRDEFPQVERFVSELAQKDGLPMPELYFVDTPVPNAFATGRSHKKAVVAVTSGIMDLLSDNELRAVLAHELGHVKNRDMLVSTIAATIGGAVAMIAEFAFWGGALFGGDEDGGSWASSLAMIILAPLAATMIQMAVSRSREYLADEHGAKLVGHGGDLSSALKKLEGFKPRMSNIQPDARQNAAAHLMFINMFNTHGISSLFSTHPSTESRVKRLSKFR